MKDLVTFAKNTHNLNTELTNGHIDLLSQILHRAA